MSNMTFKTQEEKQHYINSLASQFVDMEEKIDEETTTGGGLIRASDAPAPIETTSFYPLVRQYYNQYNKLHMLKELRDTYQGMMDDVQDIPAYFDSAEEVYAYQKMRASVESDSNFRLERLLEETKGYASSLDEIPQQLVNKNMPVGVWIRDHVTEQCFILDKQYGKYTLHFKPWEEVRKEHAPTKKDLRQIRWEKLRKKNYSKLFLVKDPHDGQVVLAPTGAKLGAYAAIFTTAEWLITGTHMLGFLWPF